MKKVCKCGVVLALAICLLTAAVGALADETQPANADNYYGTGNPDAYAVIEIPGLGLRSTVLQNPGDDAFYVNHDAEGRESETGALFSQSSFNGTDFSETMNTIYGSSAQEDTLFGGLQSFYSDDKNFFDLQYREIDITVNGHVERWIVFAALPYSPAHLEYYYDFENARVYKSFFDYLAATRNFEANLDTPLFPKPGEQILCLSTTLKEDPTRSYTVFARRLEAIQMAEEENPYVVEALKQWNFTPSASGKPAPEITEVKSASGSAIENVIQTGGMELQEEVDDYLLVTPLMERDKAPEDIKERLQAAFDGIVANDNIADLPALSEQSTLGFDLEHALESLNAECSAKDMVVRDLFDITPFGAYKNEEYMDITLDVHATPGEALIVMQSADGEHWTTVDPQFVTINEDGSCTVRLYDLHVLAFAVKADTAEEIDTTAEDVVLSPLVQKNTEEQ